MAELASIKSGSAITDALLKAALPIFTEFVWKEYELHKDDVILSKRVWFYTFDVKVSMGLWFLERLFGPRPIPA